MKMQPRKSEYQNCFATPNQDYFKSVYEEQLAYRAKRRQKEHCHYVMRWDSESTEDNFDSTSSSADENNSPTVMTEVSKSDEEEAMDCSNQPTAASTNSLKAVENIPNKDEDNHKDIQSFKKKKRVPKLNRVKNEEKPPFLSYGWGDKQVETGRKKSHNVHAPIKSVYPAALKKLNYLKMEKTKQKLKKEKRAASASLVPLYQKPTDTSAWLSEYQRCFSRQSQRSDDVSSVKKHHDKSRKRGATQRYPLR